MKYIYFDLKTNGSDPLYSRILSLDCLCADGSSFCVKNFTVKSLHQEFEVVTEFHRLLTEYEGNVAYPNKASLSFLRECFRQYRLPFPELREIFPEETGFSPELPLEKTVMKHFFRDYENYYYLPAEDTAVHRSVAQFVDRSARVKASPETAFVKKEGTFVPSPADPHKTLFKKSYEDPRYYVLLDDAGPSVILYNLLHRPSGS